MDKENTPNCLEYTIVIIMALFTTLAMLFGKFFNQSTDEKDRKSDG